jgi:DNA replication protein DnaC
VKAELEGFAGFVKRQQDLLITGMPGTGKSHILRRCCSPTCTIRTW